MHKFFDLHVGVFSICVCVKNLVEQTIWPLLVQKCLKALGVLKEKFTF